MDLAKRAMLVSVNIKLEGLLGERRDRGASEFVSHTYSAAVKRTKTSKYLIDRQHPKVKSVIAAAQRVRDVVYRYTFPWGDSKLRLLPVKAHDEFTAKVDNALADLRGVWKDYIQVYPILVQDSEQRETGLGRLFDASQYPPQEKVRAMFYAGVEYWPMPAGGNFVADIATETANQVKASIEAANINRMRLAVNEMIDRVEHTVKLYVDKLSAYRPMSDDDGVGEVRGIFRDSLIDNVAEMGRLVRALNFTEDPGIDGLANQVSRLARFTADTLRESQANRSSMITEGQALLNKLDSYRQVDSEIDDMIRGVSDYYNVA